MSDDLVTASPGDAATTGGDDDRDATGRGRRRIAPLIVGVIALMMIGFFVVLAGADTGTKDTADSPLIGRPAPEAVGTLDDGSSFDLSRRKGSWVVLNFFDPTCVPCKREHPELLRFAEDQATLGSNGAELYSVVVSGKPPQIDKFFAENGGDWPKIYSDADEFPVAFGVAKVPETWIIDPSGVVQLRLISEVTADQLNSILQQFREQYR